MSLKTHKRVSIKQSQKTTYRKTYIRFFFKAAFSYYIKYFKLVRKIKKPLVKDTDGEFTGKEYIAI